MARPPGQGSALLGNTGLGPGQGTHDVPRGPQAAPAPPQSGAHGPVPGGAEGAGEAYQVSGVAGKYQALPRAGPAHPHTHTRVGVRARGPASCPLPQMNYCTVVLSSVADALAQGGAPWSEYVGAGPALAPPPPIPPGVLSLGCCPLTEPQLPGCPGGAYVGLTCPPSPAGFQNCRQDPADRGGRAGGREHPQAAQPPSDT